MFNDLKLVSKVFLLYVSCDVELNTEISSELRKCLVESLRLFVLLLGLYSLFK